MIRATTKDDAGPILALVEASGQFDEDGLEHVRHTLQMHFEAPGPEVWLTADDGEVVGVAYCMPEPVTRGTWNLLMLWTRDDRRGQGHGSALVEHLERILETRQARLLIVETSGTPEFEGSREFYARIGFTEEARIKDFFDAGDDKIVLTKTIASSGPAA